MRSVRLFHDAISFRPIKLLRDRFGGLWTTSSSASSDRDYTPPGSVFSKLNPLTCLTVLIAAAVGFCAVVGFVYRVPSDCADAECVPFVRKTLSG